VKHIVTMTTCQQYNSIYVIHYRAYLPRYDIIRISSL